MEPGLVEVPSGPDLSGPNCSREVAGASHAFVGSCSISGPRLCMDPAAVAPPPGLEDVVRSGGRGEGRELLGVDPASMGLRRPLCGPQGPLSSVHLVVNDVASDLCPPGRPPDRPDPLSDPSTALPPGRAPCSWADEQWLLDEPLGPVKPFEEVPADWTHNHDWKVYFAVNVRCKEPIGILETRGVFGAVRHHAQSHRAFRARALFLTDNTSVALGLSKGRSANLRFRSVVVGYLPTN